MLRSEAAVTFVFIALVGPALLATAAWTAIARRIGPIEQPEAAITGIVLSFSVLPALLMALSLLTLHGLSRDDIDAVMTANA